MEDSFAINRANWDERAPAHAASPDYAVDRFTSDPSFLSEVVRFDLPRLGEVAGLDGVHLQCHIGTDTISLARLGARMTGLDFSPAAIVQARRISAAAGNEVEFVQASVYDAASVLGREQFDFVFTGIGALCWLPKIRPWAQVVAELLRPGGWLFIREGHPMLWAVDERAAGALTVEFPYFEHDEPIVWDGGGTYVETDVEFKHKVSHSWNHGLGQIVTALLDGGMHLTMLVEHDSAPWEALPGMMERTDANEWRLADRPERLPHTYTLRAVKDA
ncbi:MAG TPA: class I SAM-dependent methyltransferase [Solirubrobacteraceae bacterium]|nr:class I SAM-dependent methyltransferase [Solirubrobacteraceae bacterium]